MSDEPSIPWIRAAKLNKVLAWCLVAETVCIVGLSVALTTLFPLKETETIFVEMKTSDDNFVILHRAGEDVSANMALVGHFMRLYVDGREKVDKTTEKIRYPRVDAMSSKVVGKNFQTMVMDKQVSAYLRPNLKRHIEIIRDVPIARGIHQVIFDRIDSYDDKPTKKPDVTRWAATIRYKFIDQKVPYSRTNLNPIGLFVDQYTLTPTE